MVRYSKTNNIHKIVSQDNILGISFFETNSNEATLEVVEWNFHNTDKSKTKTSKEEVREQVLSGLEWINKSLGTNYTLSKIYFSPFDLPANRIYSVLIKCLIRHYHMGNKFKEV